MLQMSILLQQKVQEIVQDCLHVPFNSACDCSSTGMEFVSSSSFDGFTNSKGS
jgi:hypothetical protein